MLRYYKPLKDSNGYTYSCDMIRLRFDFPNDQIRQNAIMSHFTADSRTDIEIYPVCVKSGKYRNLVQITLDSDASYTVGFCFNGFTREDSKACFLEFNPNKVLSSKNAIQFKKDWNIIKTYCDFEIVRFDLAVDIPLPRQDVYFLKDGRKYECSRMSDTNNTEWLGCRNQDGRVKLYNKALESVVDVDGVKLENLTRCEITSGSLSALHCMKLFPELYTRVRQMDIPVDLSNTQFVLVEALRQCDNPEVLLNKLTDRRIKAKLKPYVLGVETKINMDIQSVILILEQIQNIVKAFYNDCQEPPKTDVSALVDESPFH